MNFKNWLLTENHFILPLNKIWGSPEKLRQSIDEVLKGQISYSSNKPIIVSQLDNPKNHFYLMDGYHRVIEAFQSNQLQIPAVIDIHIPRIERTGGAYSDRMIEKVLIVDSLKTILNQG